jgi:hypothetical protein
MTYLQEYIKKPKRNKFRGSFTLYSKTGWFKRQKPGCSLHRIARDFLRFCSKKLAARRQPITRINWGQKITRETTYPACCQN